MTRVNQDRAMTIFAEAAELPAGQRPAFLDAACAADPELRREVEELLACDDTAAATFDAAAQHIVQPDPDRIGPYEIIDPIGEGGMAVVYRAQQHHPVRRTVAVKLMKLGMDTRQFVARFESERQALALMDHPNVARVYDAGSTETGRPYFVMEYVAGEPLLDYCDARHLELRRRLELFAVVCEAVEHAHRKGIIHRDLKNSNVLVAEVDGRPVPKVIDFGVAKTIQQPLTDRALQTEQGQLIGTPEYMSPEQAERGGLDVDTRTDVYSLGVLLYELIAGVQPIASDVLRSGSYEQVQRVIRESEPQRPSTRLSTLGADARLIAQRRRTALPTLIRSLRSELEWIPLKAMRKDREQRYRSAAELADDVRNYLGGRPLIAGPEAASYKVRKFLRRHRGGVAAVLIAVVLLLVGAIATGWQAVRATRAESRAFEERNNANATLAFLTRSIVGGATPEKIPDAKVRQQIVDAMIMPAARDVGETFKDRPLVEASARTAIQDVLALIGRSDLALPHAETALSIRRRMLGDDHPDTVASLSNYADVLEALGRFAEAEPLRRDVINRSRRTLGEDHPGAIGALGSYGGTLQSLGQAAAAEPFLRQALEGRRRVQGDDDPDTIVALNNYAAVLDSLDRTAEAERLYRQAHERSRRVLGEDHPQTMTSLSNLARTLRALGRTAEAEPLFKDALERARRILGEDHPATIQRLGNYASALKSLRRMTEAEPLFKDALDRARRVLGEDHPETIVCLNNYASVLNALGRWAEAEPLYRQAYERFSRLLGEDHEYTLGALSNDAEALIALGRANDAEPLARRAVAKAAASSSLGRGHMVTRLCAVTHAKALDALGRRADAAAVRREFSIPDPSTQPASQPATAHPR